jgi:hypothetical protein
MVLVAGALDPLADDLQLANDPRLLDPRLLVELPVEALLEGLARIDAARRDLRARARLVGMVEDQQLPLPAALARHVREDALSQVLALREAL